MGILITMSMSMAISIAMSIAISTAISTAISIAMGIAMGIAMSIAISIIEIKSQKSKILYLKSLIINQKSKNNITSYISNT